MQEVNVAQNLLIAYWCVYNKGLLKVYNNQHSAFYSKLSLFIAFCVHVSHEKESGYMITLSSKSLSKSDRTEAIFSCACEKI